MLLTIKSVSINRVSHMAKVIGILFIAGLILLALNLLEILGGILLLGISVICLLAAIILWAVYHVR